MSVPKTSMVPVLKHESRMVYFAMAVAIPGKERVKDESQGYQGHRSHSMSDEGS